MTNKRLTAAMMVVGLFAVTCGGSVVEREEGEAGSAGQAGTGTGGVMSMGGGGPAGAGGHGGSVSKGGAPATGGSGMGKGGAPATGGSGVVCPSLPNCNWCDGQPVLDALGCTVGWVCANGVDPCATQPCKMTGCPAEQLCGADGLCWNTNTSCSPKMCYGVDSSCECSWTCGANAYKTNCKVSSYSNDCDCFENGVSNMSCGGYNPDGTFSCEKSCCGFPEYEP